MNEQDRNVVKSTEPGKAGPAYPPSVDATVLFGEHREIVIMHRGERYRLRVTQSDKLILTK